MFRKHCDDYFSGIQRKTTLAGVKTGTAQGGKTGDMKKDKEVKTTSDAEEGIAGVTTNTKQKKAAETGEGNEQKTAEEAAGTGERRGWRETGHGPTGEVEIEETEPGVSGGVGSGMTESARREVPAATRGGARR